MRQRAKQDFARLGIADSMLSYQPTVEMRYIGQFHEVEIELPAGPLNDANLKVLLANFHAKYEKMYMYSMPWRSAEFLTFRLKVTASARPLRMAVGKKTVGSIEIARHGSRRCLFAGHQQRIETPVYDWDRLEPGHQLVGPALIDDKTTSVLVVPGLKCEVDAYRNLVMQADQVAVGEEGATKKRRKAAGVPELVRA